MRCFGFSTIQPTPNLSATMPKRWAKKVSLIGRLTLPPWASALNSFSASALLQALRVSAMPENDALPVQWPSDAMTCSRRAVRPAR